MLALRLAAAVALFAVAVQPVSAQDSGFPGAITGSAALATDYVFRGVSQTDNDPAVQVGLEYGLELGSVAPISESGARTSTSPTPISRST